MRMLREPLRYGPSGNERTGCSNGWCSGGIALGKSSSTLRGICYRLVRESVTSARRGTLDVPNKSSVEKIHCRVKRVGALRDLGIRHVMERL